MYRFNNQEGFTFVELICVIMLLAILSAVALPRFFSIEDYNQSIDTTQIVNVLRYGQKLAIASGCPSQIVFSNQGYSVRQHEESCMEGDFVIVKVSHPYSSGAFKSQNVTWTASSIIFDSLGRASQQTDIQIGDKSLRVYPETGFVGEI